MAPNAPAVANLSSRKSTAITWAALEWVAPWIQLRPTPPTPLPDRDPALTEAEEAAAPDETAYDAVADDQEADAAGSREQEEEESAEPATDSNRGVGTLPWLQVGLGLLLLLLAGLTFYARKQR